jgi:hypothetical protein
MQQGTIGLKGVKMSDKKSADWLALAGNPVGGLLAQARRLLARHILCSRRVLSLGVVLVGLCRLCLSCLYCTTFRRVTQVAVLPCNSAAL